MGLKGGFTPILDKLFDEETFDIFIISETLTIPSERIK